MEKPKAINK